MLTRARISITAVLLAVLITAFGSAVTTTPAAASGCTEVGGIVTCDNSGTVPGEPSSPPEGAPVVGPAPLTPGPTTCVNEGPEGPEEVPCSTGDNWWSNENQCYWSLEDPQRAAPPGADPAQGAWYACDPICDEGATGGELELPSGPCYRTSRWQETPPPGINRYTPAQAAGALAASIVLSPIEIGMAPEEKVHSDDPPGTAPYRRTWVGIPVWLWVADPSPHSWGPLEASDTFGGVSISGRATVTSLTWDSGDGQRIQCGAGTPFDAAAMADKPAVDSPTCGFRYQQTGTFTASATTTWVLEWTGGNESGRIIMPTTTTSTEVQVGELQSVNVTPPSS